MNSASMAIGAIFVILGIAVMGYSAYYRNEELAKLPYHDNPMASQGQQLPAEERQKNVDAINAAHERADNVLFAGIGIAALGVTLTVFGIVVKDPLKYFRSKPIPHFRVLDMENEVMYIDPEREERDLKLIEGFYRNR